MSKISKRLSYLLRHEPEDLDMNIQGWVSVDKLIDKLDITLEELTKETELDDKQRFDLDLSNNKIRANQGHSIEWVELDLERKEPPTFLFHGTKEESVKSIRKEGMKKQTRNHIHLSTDIGTAWDVGKRYSKKDNPEIIRIRAIDMYNDGYDFFLSKNNVWLVDYIPPEYILDDTIIASKEDAEIFFNNLSGKEPNGNLIKAFDKYKRKNQ
jgi:putative RNA 2'-phosphotransferase